MFEVNVVDLRLDVFRTRFVANKEESQKGSLFSLKFVMHILSAKLENVSLNRILVNGYFIVNVALLFFNTASSTVILTLLLFL